MSLSLHNGPVLPEDSRQISVDALIEAALLKEGEGSCPYWVSRGGEFIEVQRREVGGAFDLRLAMRGIDQDADSDSVVREKRIFYPDAFDVARVTRKGVHYTLSTSSVEHPDPFDLDNLLFVDREKVEETLKQLEAAAQTAKSGNNLVLLVLGNGGTLAMSQVDGRLVPTLNVKELISLGGRSVSNNFRAVGLDVMGIDSSDYQWAFTGDITIILSYIMKYASGDLRERLCVMVTNGTDTAVEGSSNLKAQLGPEFPVPLGFVSANVTSLDDPSDVAVNVMSAVSIMKYMKKKRSRGVFIFSGGNNGWAFNPFWTVKSNDSHVNIFASPYGDPYADLGHLLGTGWHDEFDRQYYEAIGVATNTVFAPIILDGNSAGQGGIDLGNPAITFTARVGETPLETLIAIAVARRLKKMGVILGTFGGFTYNNQRLSVIEQECRDRMLLVASSPFARGQTHEYATAKRIVEMGGVVTTMSPHATMLKLMFANAIWPGDLPRIGKFIAEHDYVGEQPRYHKRPYPYLGTPEELHQRNYVKGKKKTE